MPYSLRQHSKVGLFISSGLDEYFLPEDFDFRSSRSPHKRESFSRRDARVSRSARRLRGENRGLGDESGMDLEWGMNRR